MKGLAQAGMEPRDHSVPARIRPRIDEVESSLIREVASRGMDSDDVLALWFGEGNVPTPKFIVDAAKRALDQGHVFYTDNQGITPLRQALAGYISGLYGVPMDIERISVTASGMSAITVAMQLLVEPGDNVVITGPVWPNCIETVRIAGADPRVVQIELGEDGWSLDLDRLFDSVDENTRAFFINSPNNPTGWVMPEEQQREVLDFCRGRGIWLIADEVYDRLVYQGRHAPSFHTLADPDDPVIIVNSFSKSWSMTGWRMGWMVTPARLGLTIGKLIEYNFSCVATFIQHAGIVAVEEGEPFVAELVERYRRGRDVVYQRLAGIDRVRMALPEAAFYAFFAVDGMADSTDFAIRLLEEKRVGLAPGAAFGPGGEGHLRLCFAATEATLSESLGRIAEFIER
jgi:aspartate/methionine/tyrosine aminotransferase